MDFYTEILAEKEKALWRITFGVSVFTIATIILFAAARGFWTAMTLLTIHVVLAAISWGEIFIGNSSLRTAYWDFCEHRIIPLGRRLHAEYPEIQILLPKRKIFRRETDLRALEERICGYLRNERRFSEEDRKYKKWEEQGKKFQAELASVLASSPFPQDERDRILDICRRIPNPKHKQSFVLKVQYILAYNALAEHSGSNGHAQPNTGPEKIPAANTDWQLNLLEIEAEQCVSDAARELYGQAMQAKERRARIRLLKQAIRTDEETVKEKSVSAKKNGAEITAPMNAEVKNISLNSIMEERFHIEHLLPASVDAVMAKEILLVLLQPGKLERKFQNSYRKESRIKRMVNSRFHAWVDAPFNSSSFHETAGWLVREGVLRRKSKTGEYVYSLSANTREAKNDSARAIIAAVLHFDHEIHHLNIW